MESVLPAVYRSNDPIENLLIRVTARVRALPNELPNDTVSSSYGSTAIREEDVISVESHHEFAWQEKIFGPAELLTLVAGVAQRRAGVPITAVDADSPLGAEYLEHIATRLNDEGLEGILAVPNDGMMIYTVTDRDMSQTREVSLVFIVVCGDIFWAGRSMERV